MYDNKYLMYRCIEQVTKQQQIEIISRLKIITGVRKTYFTVDYNIF
jgi:hypothetical protein